MLILTRKPGESIFIGDQVKVTIVEIKGHQIRVGIDAPPELRIYREEIYLQILEENKQAAQSGGQPEGRAFDQLASAWNKPLTSKLSKLGSTATSLRDPAAQLPEIKVSKKRNSKREGEAGEAEGVNKFTDAAKRTSDENQEDDK